MFCKPFSDHYIIKLFLFYWFYKPTWSRVVFGWINTWMFYVLFYIFRSKFGVGGFTHWPQQGKVGYALLQFSKGFKIIHLITKPKYFHKPKYLYVWRALVDLRQLCISRNLKKIVMPKIACGLDQKNYKIVRCMIAFVFYQCPMEIIICKF